MNNDPAVDVNDPRWLVSAMADGEAGAAELGRVCAGWASADAQTRQSWHAYHLIGDVLRSGDLACTPGHDRAFLERLSLRLEVEPTILAPAPLRAVPKRRPSWALPAALAAGMMALATVLVVALSPSGNGSSAPVLAAAPVPPATVALSDSAVPVNPDSSLTEAVPAGGRLVRDAQLDRYLRAHREYATALPGSLPGGSGRSVTAVSFER
jgi:sigma-E factor negative regulatory protein RseA